VLDCLQLQTDKVNERSPVVRKK